MIEDTQYKVSAIVVTFNRVKKLKDCVKCLLSQKYKLNNIIIVNNASTDNTKDYLRKLSNNKIIIKNMKKNVGGSGGFNEGIKIAYEYTKSNLFWIMDDDALPTTNSLNSLVNSAKVLKNNFGFLCSNVRSKNNNPCNLPTVDIKDWSRLLPGNLIQVKTATFVSYMVTRKDVKKLGLPIAPMFIWGDDFEYSLRMYNYKPCYFVDNSIVIHNSNDSESSLFNMEPSRDKYLRYDFRNELYAIRKHGNMKDLILKILKDLYFIAKVPFVSKETRSRKMYYMISGFINGFFFNPKVEFPHK